MEFFGYERAVGSAGIRNIVAIISTGFSTNELTTMIAGDVNGTVPILPSEVTLRLREDKERHTKTLIGLGKNPNVAAVLLVGSEEEDIDTINQEIAKSKKPVEAVTILKSNGFQQAFDRGKVVAERFLAEISQQQRKSFSLSHHCKAMTYLY